MGDSCLNDHSCCKVLTLKTINPNVLRLEYAVRGPIVQRANLLERELKDNSSAPFSQIIKCNIGDCHATGQRPITFYRQVMAILCCPSLLEDSNFPPDAKERAKRILSSCSGKSVGSYSDSLGLRVIREDVATFIEQRDGIPSNVDDIFLSCGASEAIKYVLHLLSTGLDGDRRAGVMVPVPQYPLYSATTAEFNLFQISYYLDEARNWALNLEELTRALTEAQGKCIPRAIVVINPGNPTGQVLSREGMEQVIRFAVQNRLVLLADEVYQFNIHYPERYPWTSFKRVLHEMGAGFSDRLELASFMSCSKGFMGECGFRGGYCELTNFDPDVRAQLYKALSARLCSPVLGQAMVGCFVNPPKKHEPSYAQYNAERDAILEDLRHKAEMVKASFDAMPGVSCNIVQGAMYAFPRISLPAKAIEAAEKCGQKPDFFYCIRLLEEKGVCIVPGSGFGQTHGTYHFRTTILPSVEQMKVVLSSLVDFHTKFLAKYAD
ncbi:unnamed protein product [Dicrocoelium dendriticum]|nr:unnamed protein product [Dicrocoelium dendriticum]